MKVLTGRQPRPRRILLYGIHGWGKSTWAAHAPNPLFLNIEDGLGDIDCAKTEQLTDYGSVIEAIMWLAEAEHNYASVVIDTLDWLEQLIHKAVAAEAKVENIEKIGYGKGYKLAVQKWQYLIDCLKYLRQSRGMMPIMLAHAKIDTFENPEGERYDRYEPDLHELASSLIQEWVDELFFANFRVNTVSEDLGFNKKRTRATGGKERIIKTQESAAALAKNRLGLPEQVTVGNPAEFWASFETFMPPIGQSPRPASAAALAPSPGVLDGPLVDFPPKDEGNIAGLVNNGSSKPAHADSPAPLMT